MVDIVDRLIAARKSVEDSACETLKTDITDAMLEIQYLRGQVQALTEGVKMIVNPPKFPEPMIAKGGMN
jgi:hypothetical protein